MQHQHALPLKVCVPRWLTPVHQRHLSGERGCEGAVFQGIAGDPHSPKMPLLPLPPLPMLVLLLLMPLLVVNQAAQPNSDRQTIPLGAPSCPFAFAEDMWRGWRVHCYPGFWRVHVPRTSSLLRPQWHPDVQGACVRPGWGG